jgi:integrase
MRKRLTEMGVEKLKPTPGKQVDYFDLGMPGLVLRISYGGTKTWRALFYVAGKAKSVGLGRHPVLGLREARDKARLFLQNPQAALNKPKQTTVSAVTDDFMQRYVRVRGLRTEREIKRYLEHYVLPDWQDRAVHEISRDDVTALLDRISDTHTVRQADKVLAILRKMFRWYESGHAGFTSPIVAGMKRAPITRRDRVLSDDELRDVWTVAADMGPFGAIVRLLLLTAQREAKVAQMRWTDVVDGVWTVATVSREKGNAGTLKLPQTALDILTEQPRFAGNNFVFASRGSKHFNDFGLRKAQLDQGTRQLRQKGDPNAAPLPSWRLHDLRRTAKSLMSRARVLPHVSERVLGHVMVGVEGIYDRHTYYEEKSEALEKLAALIDRIVHPQPNVLPLARSA